MSVGDESPTAQREELRELFAPIVEALPPAGGALLVLMDAEGDAVGIATARVSATEVAHLLAAWVGAQGREAVHAAREVLTQLETRPDTSGAVLTIERLLALEPEIERALDEQDRESGPTR